MTWFHDKRSVAKFTVPVNGFQVVPPDQAQKIYKALKEKGLPVALVEYEGEQHGFRKVVQKLRYFYTFSPVDLPRLTWLAISFTILNRPRTFTLEQQMVFFARLVGKFEVADEITPIKIENFD